jgi:hypothetical protein
MRDTTKQNGIIRQVQDLLLLIDTTRTVAVHSHLRWWFRGQSNAAWDLEGPRRHELVALEVVVEDLRLGGDPDLLGHPGEPESVGAHVEPSPFGAGGEDTGVIEGEIEVCQVECL